MHLDAQLIEQGAAEQGADHADGDIGLQAKPAALHDFTSEPAGNAADQQEKDDIHTGVRGAAPACPHSKQASDRVGRPVK